MPPPARSASDLTSPRFFDTVALLSRREVSTIATPPEIARFFSRIFVDRGALPVTIPLEGGEIQAQLAPVAGPELVEGLRLSCQSPLPTGPAAVILRRLSEVHVFSCRTRAVPEQDLPLPEKVFAIHRRREDRRPAASLGVRVELAWPPAASPLAGDLLDLSSQGFGVALPSGAERLPLLEEIAFTATGTGVPVLSAKAEVAHITSCERGVVVGLRLTRAKDEADPARFFDAVFPRLFPGVELVRSERGFSLALDLVRKMAGPALLSGEERLLETWRTLGEEPDRLGEVFLERRKGVPSATMTASRVFARTWLLHTFAIDSRDAFHLPIEMFSGICDHVVRKNRAEFVGGMWPSAHRFMDRYYAAFVRRDFDPADHHFEEVFVARFRTSGSAPGGGVETEDPLRAREALRAKLSPVLFDAADWAADCRLDEVGAAYRRAGHLRERVVLRLGGARAVLEFGTGAAGAFGPANSMRVLLPEGDPAATLAALVAEGRRQYRLRNIPFCFLYLDKPRPEVDSLPGFDGALGAIHLWLVRRTRIKAFFRHLERVNWELGLFRGGKVRIRPSVLAAFDYSAQPFRPRKCMRLEDPAGIEGVECRLALPGRPAFSARPLTLDTYGLGVTLPSAQALRPEETVEVALTLPKTPRLGLSAVVRYVDARVAPGFQAQAAVAGLEFLTAPAADLEAIREFVLARLNPDVRLFAPEDFEPLADLLDRAKYFDYFERHDHARMVAAAEPTYRELPSLYPNAARTTVLKDGAVVIGTHSLYRLNAKTWQLHQLAVDPDRALYKRKIPTKSILQSTFQFLSLDPTVEYFVTYFNDDAPIARAYFEAAQSHYDARDVMIQPCRWTPIDVSAVPLGSRSVSCGHASDTDIVSIARHLKERTPAMEYDALDYIHPLARGRHADCAVPIPGSRACLVARNAEEEVCGFALVNLGPANLNVLGVLDNFRVFDGPFDDRETSSARKTLVRFVLAFFAQQSRKNVFFEREESDSLDYVPLGIRNVGKTWRLIAKRAAFLTALRFFLNRFGRLEERIIGRCRER